MADFNHTKSVGNSLRERRTKAPQKITGLERYPAVTKYVQHRRQHQEKGVQHDSAPQLTLGGRKLRQKQT
ncbi:MAG: hypothetical protein ACE14L_03380 [Terriglobales bacterium]